MPHDLPPWETAYASFRRWQDDGTCETVVATLRRDLRIAQGRDPEPSAAVLDGQTVKTTGKGGHAATTRGRRRRAANATVWSIPTGC